MKRRDFLKISNALIFGGLSPLSLTQRSFANELIRQDDRFFVMLRMTGGWDVTLNIDPKVHSDGSTQKDMFIEYRPEDIIRAGTLSLGPAMTSLADFAPSMTVVNGIIMNSADNGHDASLNFLSTGSGDGTAPTLPVEIANSQRSGPFGVAFHGQLNVYDREIMATEIRDIQNITSAVSLKGMSQFLGNLAGDSSFRSSTVAFEKNSKLTNTLSQAIEERQEILSQLNDQQDLRSAHILAALFTTKSAYQGLIDLENIDLDSHTNHEGQHLASQVSAWNRVSEIFKLFSETPYGESGESLYDRTTFMVLSEFSRTPDLNSGKGKDHNPLTNSVLLAGGNINGGQTIGASHLIKRSQSSSGTPKHTALPINYRTGEVAMTREQALSSDFKFITPDRVVATVAMTLGIDPDRFRSTSLDKPILPNIIKA
jgi:uncharacterized protein (DUF1501 family)